MTPVMTCSHGYLLGSESHACAENAAFHEKLSTQHKAGLPALPILRAHKADPDNVIGRASFDERGLVVEFLDGNAPTREEFFRIFGNAGFTVLMGTDSPEGWRIVKAQIHEFSL